MAFTSKQKLKTLIKFLFEKGAAKVLDPGFHFDLQKSLNIYLQFMEIAFLKCFWMSAFKPKPNLNMSHCWI